LGEQYKSFSSSLCNLLHSPVTSSLLGPNILLNIMFSNTLSFISSRNVNDQVSHPYKTIGKIIVLYILIFNLYKTSNKKNVETREICGKKEHNPVPY
jgi:fumarate reductase subunit D